MFLRLDVFLKDCCFRYLNVSIHCKLMTYVCSCHCGDIKTPANTIEYMFNSHALLFSSWHCCHARIYRFLWRAFCETRLGFYELVRVLLVLSLTYCRLWVQYLKWGLQAEYCRLPCDAYVPPQEKADRFAAPRPARRAAAACTPVGRRCSTSANRVIRLQSLPCVAGLYQCRAQAPQRQSRW